MLLDLQLESHMKFCTNLITQFATNPKCFPVITVFVLFMQEVCYRKVLEDDGNRQLVEVEQLGRWRFLMISGTFSSHVMVEQNCQEHQVHASLVHANDT